MMRKVQWYLYGIFLLCCILLNGVKAEAATSSDGYWKYTITDSEEKIVTVNGITTAGKKKYGTTYTIPTTIDGYSVTKIGESSFKDDGAVKKVVIPEGVEEIENMAFFACDGMTELSLPDTLIKIGQDAFNSCLLLEDIAIPESVSTIRGGAFWYTIWLDNQRKNSDDNLVIVNNILIDGRRCDGDVVIPDGVTMIAEMAFYGPYYILTGGAIQGAELTSVTVPASVTTVGRMSFYQCEQLKTVTLQDGVTTISPGAFFGCTALENVQLSDSLTALGMKSFYQCTSLKEIVIPEGVGELRNATFSGCTALEKITLPAALATVGEDVFPDNDGLVIVIPEELTDISNLGLTELSNVVFQVVTDSPVIVYLTENNITYNTYESETKGDGEENDPNENNPNEDTPTEDDSMKGDPTEDNSAEGGSSGDNTNVTNENNESDTTKREEQYQKGKTYTVNKCKYKVLSKGKVAFVGCTNKKVKKLTIPAKVKLGDVSYRVVSVGKRACKGYSKLTTVTVGKYVSSVGDEAFMNCKKLKRITFGASVKTIGKRVLKGDKRIRMVTFKGKKLARVGKGTFQGVPIGKVTFKVPKSKNGKYVKKYRKLFQNAV